MPFPYTFPIIFDYNKSLVAVIDGEIPYLQKGSPVIETRIEERSTASFTIEDLLGAASYQKGQAITIYDTADELFFGGVIDSVETVRIAPSGELHHHIRCVDYHYFADKRLVAESYENKTCGFIVGDLRTKYLDDEGITVGNIELGATLIEAIFNYVRCSDAFDALAEKAGKIWYIDENKKLYFQNRDTTASPWTITGDDIIKGSGRLIGGNPLYRNRQYIRGGRGTTVLQTETFAGDANTVAFTVGYPIVEEPEVRVNAVLQTIGLKGIDVAKQSYWTKGDATILLAAAPGAVAVEVKYYGEYDVLTLIEDDPAIAAQLAIEGVGTGYVDDIADEPTLNDIDALLDSGKAKLARFGVVGQRFNFQTTRLGLKPDQLLTVNYPVLGLAGDMLIESVTITAFAGNVTYEVTAIQGPEMGSWVNLFKALASMKREVIEYLNVGSNQILIILADFAEGVEVTETTTDTIFACFLVDSARVDVATVC